MCYINSVKVSLDTFIQYKQQQKQLRHLEEALLMQPARRGFEFSDWPIIKPDMDGKDWNVVAGSWGYIPDYVKTHEDLKKMRQGYVGSRGAFLPGKPMLNVVGEEMLSNAIYRQSALTRRILVLSTGFNEHQHVIEVGKRGKPLKTPVKYPYRIYIPNKPYFLMAGISNPWLDPETGEIKDTFAIITTDATDHNIMSQVHNSKLRMPVILPDAEADEWTDPDLTEGRILQLAKYQYPAEQMHAYPVSKDFLDSEDPTALFAYETSLTFNSTGAA